MRVFHHIRWICDLFRKTRMFLLLVFPLAHSFSFTPISSTSLPSTFGRPRPQSNLIHTSPITPLMKPVSLDGLQSFFALSNARQIPLLGLGVYATEPGKATEDAVLWALQVCSERYILES